MNCTRRGGNSFMHHAFVRSWLRSEQCYQSPAQAPPMDNLRGCRNRKQNDRAYRQTPRKKNKSVAFKLMSISFRTHLLRVNPGMH